jgi:hypothetical protein
MTRNSTPILCFLQLYGLHFAPKTSAQLPPFTEYFLLRAGIVGACHAYFSCQIVKLRDVSALHIPNAVLEYSRSPIHQGSHQQPHQLHFGLACVKPSTLHEGIHEVRTLEIRWNGSTATAYLPVMHLIHPRSNDAAWSEVHLFEPYNHRDSCTVVF